MVPRLRTGSIHDAVTVPASPLPTPSQGHPAPVHARVFALTDVGRTREHNEDAFLVADLESGAAIDFGADAVDIRAGAHGALFLVADGMGGAASGELASSMAAELVLSGLRNAWRAADPSVARFAEALRDATIAANHRIHTHARENPEHRGMGTTATIAGLYGDHLYVVQVGDSRAYLVREGQAQMLTKDQSLVQRLVEAGELTPEEAERSERRNIILQALGPEPNVTVDITHQQVRRGDILILCSDGLSGQVKADEIAYVAQQEPDVVGICRNLVDRANARGGPDNITVVAVRFDGEALSNTAAGDQFGYRVFPLAGTLNDASRLPTPIPPANTIKSDPTPRFGTPKPSEATLQAARQQAIERAAAAVAAPEEDLTGDGDPQILGLPEPEIQERRERAQPIYFVLGLIAVAAIVFAVLQLRR
jgi:protein phosphatase